MQSEGEAEGVESTNMHEILLPYESTNAWGSMHYTRARTYAPEVEVAAAIENHGDTDEIWTANQATLRKLGPERIRSIYQACMAAGAGSRELGGAVEESGD